MKPRKIRRDIGSPHRASEHDGPNLGRVARVRDPHGPRTIGWTSRRGGHRSGRSAAASPAAVSLRFWSIVFTVVTLLTIIGFALFWIRSHRGGPSAIDTPDLPENVRVRSLFASPSEDEALALVKRAMDNRNPALVTQYLRPGEATPEEVVAFMAGMEDRDGGVDRTEWLGSMDVEGMLMDGVLVTCKGNSKPFERLALLLPDDSGVWKMDFEGFARTSRPSWKEFLGRKADRARVRVIVADDVYYNGPFIDENLWRCYAMVSNEARELLPEDQSLLRGYCRKDSPQARAMERIFADGSRMKRVTIEIARKEGSGPRQFEITRVLAADWALPPEPFDAKFD